MRVGGRLNLEDAAFVLSIFSLVEAAEFVLFARLAGAWFVSADFLTDEGAVGAFGDLKNGFVLLDGAIGGDGF